jgi:hypothetical protein
MEKSNTNSAWRRIRKKPLGQKCEILHVGRIHTTQNAYDMFLFYVMMPGKTSMLKANLTSSLDANITMHIKVKLIP